MPGVLVHAQILRSMLNGGLVQSISNGWVYVALLIGAACVFLRSTGWTIAVYAAYMALLGGATLFLLRNGWFFESAGPMMATTVALCGVGEPPLEARDR